jgi:hypothetical protein
MQKFNRKNLFEIMECVASFDIKTRNIFGNAGKVLS